MAPRSDRHERIPLSLTGPQSHVLQREAGVGSLSLGPAGGPRVDLVVDPDAAIDWTCFDPLSVPSGTPWPRWLSYRGNDVGVFEWMRSRESERLWFAPMGDLDLDASDARLAELTLRPGPHRVALTLPRSLRRLRVEGAHPSLMVRRPEGSLPLDLTLAADAKASIPSLPPAPWVSAASALGIEHDVMGEPFDCRSLAALPHLRHLRVHGPVTHLDALAEVPLESLELRFAPELAGVPAFEVWPHLTRFIAWNVDECAGKALRSRARARAKVLAAEGFDEAFFSVSKLRSPRWFREEHGLPFAAWPAKSAKTATRAYREASRALDAATDSADARAAVTHFVDRLNALPDVMTSEREDAARAIVFLAETHPTHLDVDVALAWFDAARDF